MTGSTHANHHSARSPRPTPEGPARDNPITGPLVGTTRSEPSPAASAAASGRHKEPSSWPASTCAAQAPGKSWGASTQGGGRHHGVRKPDGSTESERDRRRRGSFRRGRQARQRGTPPATTEAHGQVSSNTGNRVCKPRHHAQPATNNGTGTDASQHQTNEPQTRARNAGVQADGAHQHTHPNGPARSCGAKPNPKPKYTQPRRTAQPRVPGYKRSAHTNTPTPQHPSKEWRGAAQTRPRTHTLTPQTPAGSPGV